MNYLIGVEVKVQRQRVTNTLVAESIVAETTGVVWWIDRGKEDDNNGVRCLLYENFFRESTRRNGDCQSQVHYRVWSVKGYLKFSISYVVVFDPNYMICKIRHNCGWII